ncbi:MAG TPA: PAS domain S-box protein, partial [Gallionella sp.]|nr:PAS domain S-box protein [Gallionella sp.]
MTETETQLKHYQVLINNVRDGIHVMDIQGDIVEVNDAFCEMLGYTREEASKLNITDWNSQYSKEELLARLKSFVGKNARFDTVHRRKDGTLINVEVSLKGVDLEGQTYISASSRDITERKQLEHGLKLAQFSVDHAQDAIFRLNPKAQFLYVNAAACKHLEFSKDELLKMSLFDINPDFSPEDWAAHWENVSNNGSKRFETRHKRKDGTLVPVEVVANCIELEGELIFTSIVRNITERKHAEMTLLQLKAAIDTTHEGFWMTDEQGVILEANQAYAKMSGYSVDELRGMQVLQFEVKEQSLNEVKAHIEKVISQGWDVFETRHRHKDGHEIELEVSISYIPDSRQFVAFFRDIAERKQAEADLRIAATTFASQEGTMITNAQGVILRVNQAFTEDTGYTAEEAVGQTPRLLKSGRHDAAFYQAMWQAINQTGTWQGEIWDRRKNGETYPKWLTITAVKGDDGIVTHYVGIHVDITAQKRLEEERKHLFNEVRELSRRLIDIQEQERQAIALTLHDNIG